MSETSVGVPEELKQCILDLDKHYISSRYPDVYDEGAPLDYYSREDAEKGLSYANKIVE